MSECRLRWREDTGFEAHCEYCRDWWPLDLEFWSPRNSLRKCRACYLAWRRTRDKASYRANPVPKRLRSQARRDADRRRQQLARLDPERRPIILERQRQAQARYYERRGAEVREKRRLAYVASVGHEPTAGIGRPRMDESAA